GTERGRGHRADHRGRSRHPEPPTQFLSELEDRTVTTATQTPVVEMRNISVAFGGVHAVRDVSIDLYAGEVIGLVGGNGAGKSTLMRVLSGAHSSESGEILIDGKVVSIKNPRDAKAYNIETI